jgi:hypothetical protein
LPKTNIGVTMIAMEIPVIGRKRLSAEDEAELEASMSRHPSGRRQLSRQCPECGQNASGALGPTEPALAR